MKLRAPDDEQGNPAHALEEWCEMPTIDLEMGDEAIDVQQRYQPKMIAAINVNGLQPVMTSLPQSAASLA